MADISKFQAAAKAKVDAQPKQGNYPPFMDPMEKGDVKLVKIVEIRPNPFEGQDGKFLYDVQEDGQDPVTLNTHAALMNMIAHQKLGDIQRPVQKGDWLHITCLGIEKPQKKGGFPYTNYEVAAFTPEEYAALQ